MRRYAAPATALLVVMIVGCAGSSERVRPERAAVVQDPGELVVGCQRIPAADAELFRTAHVRMNSARPPAERLSTAEVEAVSRGHVIVAHVLKTELERWGVAVPSEVLLAAGLALASGVREPDESIEQALDRLAEPWGGRDTFVEHWLRYVHDRALLRVVLEAYGRIPGRGEVPVAHTGRVTVMRVDRPGPDRETPAPAALPSRFDGAKQGRRVRPDAEAFDLWLVRVTAAYVQGDSVNGTACPATRPEFRASDVSVDGPDAAFTMALTQLVGAVGSLTVEADGGLPPELHMQVVDTLRREGYIEPDVTAVVEQHGGRARLRVGIRPGPRFAVASIDGSALEGTLDGATVASIVPRPGAPLRLEEIDSACASLESELQSRGRAGAHVLADVRAYAGEERADVVFIVQ
jgi:hypothetical protein